MRRGSAWRPGGAPLAIAVLFNTVTYAYFFGAVFVVSWLLAPWRRLRLGVLLAASYVFYAGWTFVGWQRLLHAQGPAFWAALVESIKYVPLLFVATSIDYYLAVALDRIDAPRWRKLMLLGTVAVNVGILVFFKYWNWGADTFIWLMRSAFGLDVGDIHLRVELPIGISFFCFMSLSYVIDVYRRTIVACKSYLTYLTYISFFPHLVAGPIIRGRDLLPHLERDTHLTAQTGGEGMFLIAAGLFKKVVIGDFVAVNFVDRVFAAPSSFSAVEVMSAMYGYAVQIYCDFSGYSDIAIGSALLLGYRFKINFDAPFKASNVAEFWRRWHVSLSTWLRDYVYIPLGGNRRGPFRKFLNIFLTLLICGIWHGAAWTFFVFGWVHGVAVVITHYFQQLSRAPRETLRQAPAFAAMLAIAAALCVAVQLTFGHPGIWWMIIILAVGAVLVSLVVTIARRLFGEAARWPLRVFCVAANFTYIGLTFTLFRAGSLDKAGALYQRLVTLTTFTPNLHATVMLIILGALVLQWTPRRIYDLARERFIRAPAFAQALVLFMVAMALRTAAGARAVPFVYFQF